MTLNDDYVSLDYPYAWSLDSELSLDAFLTKYKPSMVQDDGTKPWLWVNKSAPAMEDSKREVAVEEATKLLKDVTERVEDIKNDESIPVRANKKKGTKSKKEVREAVQGEATEKLKDISIRHGFVVGKWLIFAPTDKVDLVWTTIATSLISGPLASTSVYSAKVATCPRNETPNHSHVLCLYVPDVYNKTDVTEIMRILLEKHGMNLMGVKSDLYTAIGLDSKHASGIPSTVWKNTALLPEAEIKKLKEEFFANLNASKAAATETAPVEKRSQDAKPKPKLKKKVEDDPFESSDDDDKDIAKAKVQKQAPRKPKPTLKKKRSEDAFASEDDAESDEEEEKRKQQVAAKKAPASKKAIARKRAKEVSDDDDDGEDNRPKKRLARK
ncbi:hypothetical protein POSPLADRAFT_1040130 [Postia placenta MAD-698-R-SB12]|uniref:Uncharacterized protein n=1 Tax=Postia placenta MAD-698-R-SB12 TaxID=670580 RepID=A0A1X6MZF5_9APHY|nr:hypothetical protein POSPLADRAFT_1040130 [Postia placenta MAD-698-R-SB12]OSX61630.1 hypothetical protein POSPLADRAFT_1040130 [Postia placenta MAD-698-R-SB12]